MIKHKNIWGHRTFNRESVEIESIREGNCKQYFVDKAYLLPDNTISIVKLQKKMFFNIVMY